MCDRVDQLPLLYYFHVIGDKLINPIIGFYIPIIRIPIIKGGMTIPNIATFDHGTYGTPISRVLNHPSYPVIFGHL